MEGLAVATKPSDLGAVSSLISEIVEGGKRLETSSEPHVARTDLLAKVRQLKHSLETPRESMIETIWSQPCNVMAITFGVTTGLWKTMAKNGSGPQKVADLAKQIGVQEELLQRMMRHIAASGYLNMTAPDEYTPNGFSEAMALEVMSAGYVAGPPILNPIFLKGPEWLKERGYVCPTEKYDTTYQAAHNTKLHWFEHLSANQPLGYQFNDHMFGYLLGRPSWYEFYNVQERLFDGFDTSDKDAFLLVDIAAGIGHYTDQFHSAHPDKPGRLAIQDLAPVLEQATALSPKIEKVPHDMFTEQPIKGARCYYTHFVLHDWPDEDCLKIAGSIRDAMKPGYSRFLLHEHVIPPTGQHYEQTALDLIMMTGFGSKERSAAQWSDLLERRVGLKIVKIWPNVNGMESVIECERPE